MADVKQLPLDLLELQIGQLDLLMAMYPEDVLIGDDEMRLLDALRSAIERGDSSDVNAARIINMVLRLPVVDEGASAAQNLQLDLTAPFTYEGPQSPEEPPYIKVRIQQPSWLSRAATSALQDTVPEGEDLLSTIEHIKESAARAYEESLQSRAALVTDVSDAGPLLRVMFYFPSISTRSKVSASYHDICFYHNSRRYIR